MARMEPLEPPYEPEVADALRRLMGSDEVEPLKLFRTIAHHPQLLDRFRQIGSTVLSFGRLEAIDRETVIHRTTARCGASYGWGALAASLSRPKRLRSHDPDTDVARCAVRAARLRRHRRREEEAAPQGGAAARAEQPAAQRHRMRRHRHLGVHAAVPQRPLHQAG